MDGVIHSQQFQDQVEREAKQYAQRVYDMIIDNGKRPLTIYHLIVYRSTIEAMFDMVINDAVNGLEGELNALMSSRPIP